MPTPPFQIVFDELAIEHLDVIENKHLSLIRNAIETQLRFEPNVETRNRKGAHPIMKIAPLAQVKDRFSAYVQESQKSPVIVTKNGKPVALLTGISDEDDLESILLAHDPRFLQILEEARQRIQRTGGIKSRDFWKAVKRRRAKKKAA